MSLTLTVLLILPCAQGLVKFAVGLFVPYSTLIRRIASCYEQDVTIISLLFSQPRARTWSRWYEPLKAFWSIGFSEYCQIVCTDHACGSGPTALL